MSITLEDFFSDFLKKLEDSDSTILKPRSQKEEKELYEKGYVSYEAGDYKQAVCAFESLLLYKPYKSAYWQALGSARQMNKEYEKSLYAWAMAMIIEPKNPYLPFHAAECCFSKNDPEEGKKALAMVKNLIDEKHELFKKVIGLEDRCIHG